jgi:hypothetical protein
MRNGITEEVRIALRDAILSGRELGYEGRPLLAYLQVVCPFWEPRELRIWAAERRRLLVRSYRRREPVRETVGWLAMGSETTSQERTPC